VSDIITYPPPVIELTEPPKGKWEKERHAFLQLLPTLLQTHRGKYVAIHDGQVVDSDSKLIPMALRVYERHGYVPIYMDLVTEQPPVVRIPHYRIIRSEVTT
jgi:hypothetical protein